MSSMLCEKLPISYMAANSRDDFFNSAEVLRIKDFFNTRENNEPAFPGNSCKTNLFFGFFFDGTKNNYVKGAAAGNQSNVARLYDCFPGQAVEGVLPSSANWQNNVGAYKHFFKVYAPGVASPFDAVRDTGEGSDLTKGAGFGYLGEDRIKWGLIQAINNLHRHYFDSPLLSPDETRSYMRSMRLTASERQQMTSGGERRPEDYSREAPRTVDIFNKLLKRLHGRLSIFWPDLATGRPRTISPAQVKKIYVSAFGFSRGAAQARAFTNWLMSLCALDAQMCKRGASYSLGGFELEFNFLGLFDTVASVGIANTLGDSTFLGRFDGHGAWADAEDSLRINEKVQQCLHLVAAHEVRRSFPVDSVHVDKTLPPNCREIIFPGVHSDLGSGYSPLEQGRGHDPSGADMLARVPLLYMYREARLAGVPLKLELAGEAVQKKFKISESVISALNQYLDFCPVRSGTITEIMRDQGRLQILWHKARRINGFEALEETGSFGRATNFDKNDLHSANVEFEDEIRDFEKWLSGKGRNFVPQIQVEGFGNDYKNEWEQIATFWYNAPALPQFVLDFFDDYVHDSHAWFKLSSDFPDNERDLQLKLVEWEKRRKRGIEDAEEQSMRNDDRMQSRTAEELDGLTADQRRAAQEFASTGDTPRLITKGRESVKFGVLFTLRGGYLRFRKVYGGADKYLLSGRNLPTTVETEAG